MHRDYPVVENSLALPERSASHVAAISRVALASSLVGRDNECRVLAITGKRRQREAKTERRRQQREKKSNVQSTLASPENFHSTSPPADRTISGLLISQIHRRPLIREGKLITERRRTLSELGSNEVRRSTEPRGKQDGQNPVLHSRLTRLIALAITRACNIRQGRTAAQLCRLPPCRSKGTNDRARGACSRRWPYR